MSALAHRASATPAFEGSVPPPARRIAVMPASRRSVTAAAAASTSANNSNVIDLTTSSPPPPDRGAASNGLSLPRPVASTSGARTGLRARGGPSRQQEVIELSSDSEGDDEIIVQAAPANVNARAGPSNARALPARAPAARAIPAPRPAARAAPAGARAAGAGARAAALRLHDFYDDYGYDDEDDDWDEYGGGGGGGAVFNYGGGAGSLALAQLMAMYGAGGAGSGVAARMQAFLGYGGDGGPAAGLQGLYNGGAAVAAGWGGAAKVAKAKKFSVKMSHPRKIEDGFSRDIIDNSSDASPPPQARKKAKKATSVSTEVLEPVCAACLETLLLAQSGQQRPWALRCGHVVCGSCIAEARARLLEARAIVLDVDDTSSKRTGKKVVRVDDDDDELEYVGDDEDRPLSTVAGPTRRSQPSTKRATPYARPAAAAKAKAHGKSKAMSTDVDEGWTSCPIVACGGERTELEEEEGGMRGAWELFV